MGRGEGNSVLRVCMSPFDPGHPLSLIHISFLQKVMQTARDLLEADEVKSAAQEDMKEMLQAAGEKLSNDKISFTGCEVYNFEVYEREDY